MSTFRQEVPPKGGFARVLDPRPLPRKGLPGIVLFGAVAAIMAYGFVKVSDHSRRRRYEYLHIPYHSHRL